MYNEARKEDKSTGCFYAGDIKSSGVRPGRIKVEVYIEQTEFSKQDKTLTLSRRFLTVWA